VPGDPVLDVTDRDVAVTGVYQGRNRLTLTYPVINRARLILWLVTGSEKVSMYKRLQAADPSITAGRVQRNNAVLLADSAAAGRRTGKDQREIA
jgi:6-phosphogluconolactonase